MRFLRLVHGGLSYFARQLDDQTARLWDGAPWNGGKETDRLVPIRSGSLLAPTAPTKIVCVGRNYRDHAKELGNEVPTSPLLFLKPPSALLPADGEIRLPTQSERVEYEGEIAVVVGAKLRDADEASAERAIFGFTAANDVTARDLQRQDVQFTRAKGFDTFCPLGPYIETDVSWSSLSISTRLNGQLVQAAAATDMVFAIPSLLAFISSVMTLEPGDVVLTGTPKGVGPLSNGDEIEISMGVGYPLRNRVAR